MRALLMLLLCCDLVSAADHLSAWRVDYAHVIPGKAPEDALVQIDLTNAKTSGQRHLRLADPYAVAIDADAVWGEDVTLLISAGRAQEVLRVRISTGTIVDKFVCYSPRFVSAHFIAGVTHYPSSAASVSADVVFVYDLAKAPAANRADGSLPKGPFGDRQAGLPVFPEENARERSYDFARPPGKQTDSVAGTPFKMDPRGCLLFVALAGESREPQLVGVDTRQRPPVTTRSVVPKSLYETLNGGSFPYVWEIKSRSDGDVEILLSTSLGKKVWVTTSGGC